MFDRLHFTMGTVAPDSDLDDSPAMQREDARLLVANILDGELSEDFSAKQILDQHPWLNQFPSCVIDLAYEEYCRYREKGSPVAASEFAGQFSGVEQSLYRVIEFDQVLHDHPSLVEEIPEERWPKIGQMFCVFYLTEQIGRGALSRVFTARQVDLGNRDVIVKVCIRGEREADLLGMLEFEGIAKVYSIHPDHNSGLVAICMPLETRVTMDHMAEWAATREKQGGTSKINGLELRRFVADANADNAKKKDTSRATEERSTSRLLIADKDSYITAVVKWGVQLSNALQHAHGNKVLHCDIKPGNVLLLPDLSAALLDFNLAASEKDAVRLAGGTLPYMASEQLRLLLNSDLSGQKQNDQDESHVQPEQLCGETDVFGLCATLWHLITGSPPFGVTVDTRSRAEAANLLLARQMKGVSPEDLTQIGKQLPAGLVNVLLKGLSFNPSDRQTSAAELSSDLESLLPRRRFYQSSLFYWCLSLFVASAAITVLAVNANVPVPVDPVRAAELAAESAASKAHALLKNGDILGAERALASFQTANSACQFLDLFRRTCVHQTTIHPFPGIQQTQQQIEDHAAWQAIQTEWSTLAEQSPFAAEAWANCFYASLELSDFTGAIDAYQKSVHAGLDPEQHPRLKLAYTLIARYPGQYGTEGTKLDEMEQRISTDGTRAELLAYARGVYLEYQLNQQLTDDRAISLAKTVLSFVDGDHVTVAETTLLQLVLLSPKSRINIEVRDQMLSLCRRKQFDQFNRLARVLLLPPLPAESSQENPENLVRLPARNAIH